MTTPDPAAKTAPPRHAVIVCHPEPDSFALAMARAYCDAVEARGQLAILRDLYRLGFDPVLKSPERLPSDAFTPAPDVAAELGLLAGAGAFVLIYPLWFGTPPAMLKGYVERVFGAGFSFEMIAGPLHLPKHALLGGKKLLSFSTSAASKEWLEEQRAWLSLQTIFDGYLARAFWMDTPAHVHFGEVRPGLDEAIAAGHLEAVRKEAGRMCDRLGAN